MMLRVRVTEPQRVREFEHAGGPLEFGRRRGQPGDRSHCELDDLGVSRRQLRIEAVADGGLEVENLSESRMVGLPDGAALGAGERRRATLPAAFTVGATLIEIDVANDDAPEAGAPEHPTPEQRDLAATVPIPRSGGPRRRYRRLRTPGKCRRRSSRSASSGAGSRP